MPLYAQQSVNQAWWGPLLEKAYAKLNVDYQNLVGGQMLEAFRDMAHMPGFSYYLRDYGDASSERQTDDEKLWNLIMEGETNDYPMTVACDLDFGGLVTQHAYTVLGAIELTKDGQPYEKLVKLRNPWAKEQYSGPWSDNDSRWTENFKEQTNLVSANDGIFYMALSDLHKGMYQLDSFLYREDWKTESSTKKDERRLQLGVISMVIP